MTKKQMNRYELHRYLQNLARLSGKNPCKKCKPFKKCKECKEGK